MPGIGRQIKEDFGFRESVMREEVQPASRPEGVVRIPGLGVPVRQDFVSRMEEEARSLAPEEKDRIIKQGGVRGKVLAHIEQQKSEDQAFGRVLGESPVETELRRDTMRRQQDQRPEAIAEAAIKLPQEPPTLAQSAGKGLAGLKVSFDFLANELAGLVGADQKETRDILQKSVERYLSFSDDPRMTSMMEEIRRQAKGSSIEAVLRTPGILAAQAQPLSIIANFLAEQVITSIPGFLLGYPVGGALARPFVNASVAKTMIKQGAEAAIKRAALGKSIETAAGGALGNSLAVVIQALGPNYIQGLQKFDGDAQKAKEYAVTKTLAEVPANALAGLALGLRIPGEVSNIISQAFIQGAGGAIGAAQASRAVGEKIDPAEAALEFWGEFLTAPQEVAISRFGGPITAKAPLEAKDVLGRPMEGTQAPATEATSSRTEGAETPEIEAPASRMEGIDFDPTQAELAKIEGLHEEQRRREALETQRAIDPDLQGLPFDQEVAREALRDARYRLRDESGVRYRPREDGPLAEDEVVDPKNPDRVYLREEFKLPELGPTTLPASIEEAFAKAEAEREAQRQRELDRLAEESARALGRVTPSSSEEAAQIEQAVARAAGSGIQEEAPPSALESAMRQAGVRPERFPSAPVSPEERERQQAESRVLGAPVEELPDRLLKYVAKKGQGRAQLIAAKEMERRSALREAGPQPEDRSWAEKLFAGGKLTKEERRRAIALGIAFPDERPNRLGRYRITSRGYAYRKQLREMPRPEGVPPTQMGLLRRSDEEAINRVNTAFGVQLRRAPQEAVPVSLDARMGSQLARSLGRRIIWVEGEGPEGFVLPEDPSTLYINVHSKRSHLVVIGHELLHTLRRTNPAVYNTLIGRLRALLRNESVYREWLRGELAKEGQSLSERQLADLAMEELVADFLGDHMVNPRFWLDVFIGLDRPLVKRLYDAMRFSLGAMILRLKGVKDFDSRRYVKDAQAARKALAQAFSAWQQKPYKEVSARQTPVQTPPREAMAADKAGRASRRERPGINVEVSPNPLDQEADRWSRLPKSAKRRITDLVAQAMVPQVMEKLGIEKYDLRPALGGFVPEERPNIVTVEPSLVVAVPEAPYERLLDLGWSLGKLWNQHSVIVYDENITQGENVHGYVKIAPSRALDDGQVEELFRQIRGRAPEAGGFTWYGNKLYLGNFSSVSDGLFRAKIFSAIRGLKDAWPAFELEFKRFRSDYLVIGEDSGESQVGEVQAGRAVLWRQRGLDSVQAESDRLVEELVQRAERGALFSRRDRAGDGEGRGSVVENRGEGSPRDLRGVLGERERNEGEKREVAPQGYTIPRVGAATPALSIRPQAPHAVTLVGIHYSHASHITELLGAAHGRGIKGEEAQRLATASPRLRKRVYFYVQTKDGALPLPEEGLGIHAYRVKLLNLYDNRNDEAYRRVSSLKKADDFNSFEEAVIEAGYDGYFNRRYDIIVLLGVDRAKVEYLGDRWEAARKLREEATVDVSAHEASTSPRNDLPQPTPAQQEAGNYQKGHVRIAGLDVSIENPAGSKRAYRNPDGSTGEATLKSHYGYIRRTHAKDGDQLDVFIRPGTPLDWSGPVWVLDQRKPGNGHFDEHKVLIGWPDAAGALQGYRENYAPGWEGARLLLRFDSPEAFRAWLTRMEPEKPVLFSRQGRPLQEDLAAQIEWLEAQAKERGYESVDQLASRDPRAFEQLAAEWRKEHPAQALFSRRSRPADLLTADGPKMERVGKRYVSEDGRYGLEPDGQGGYFVTVEGEEIGWAFDFRDAKTILERQYWEDLRSGKARLPESETVFNRYSEKQTERLVAGWRRLAEHKGAFMTPKTSATELQQIVRDMRLERLVATAPLDTSDVGQQFLLMMPDGTSAKLTVEKRYKGGKTPGAWLDARDLNKEGYGRLAYQIALAWAHNNRTPLYPDESLSYINTFRRTEQMISAALKYGTTEYMRPHPDQVLHGWIEEPRFQEEEDHNLALMLLTSMERYEENIPKLRELRYNFESRRFETKNGQPFTAGDFDALAETDAARDVGAGRTTLARVVFSRSLVNGGAGARRFVSGELSAGPLLASELPEMLRLYSRRSRAGAEPGPAITLREAVAPPARFLPGVTGAALGRAWITALSLGAARWRAPAAILDLANQIAEGIVKVPAKFFVEPITSRIYDRLSQWGKQFWKGGPIRQQIAHGLIADYGLPEPYVGMSEEREVAIHRQLRKAKSLIDRIAHLDRAQSRIAHLWLQEKPNTALEAQLLAQLPEEARTTLAQMKDEIARLGQEAVDLGLLSQETYERNKLAYLHRTYKKYELEDPLAVAASHRAKAIRAEAFRGRGLRDDVALSRLPGVKAGDKFVRLELRDPDPEGGVGPLRRVVYVPAGQAIPSAYAHWRNDGIWEARFFDKKDRVGLWRDFTPEERNRMGEIEEARYAFARTMIALVRDIETARFLKQVAETYSKDSPEEVEKAGGRIAEASDSPITLKTYADDEWVQVPTTYASGTKIRKYGALAGRYVPGHIWNDIRVTINTRANYAVWKLWDQLLRAWKISKTALSPVVHTNNIMANFVLSDAADVDWKHIQRALRLLVDAQKGDGDALAWVERYYDSGAEGASFAQRELRLDVIEPLLQELEREQDEIVRQAGLLQAISLAIRGQPRQALAAVIASRPAGATKWAVKTLMEAYQQEDSVFRFAKWLQGIEDGLSDRQAGKEARKAFLDYKINAPWIQALRAGPLPFIAFTYRVVPILANTAAKKPWKVLKWMLAFQALNALAYAMLGAAGDEERERKLLPEEKSGEIFGVFPRLMRMPWNDAHGSPVFLDIRRWVPAGDIFDVSGSQGAIPLPQWLTFGGPAALMIELAANKSLFTGNPIWDKDSDSTAEAAIKIGDHLFKWAAPNLPVPNPAGYVADRLILERGLFQTWSWSEIEKAATGETDAFGRERSLPQALLSSVGIKLGSYPEDVALRRMKAEANQALRALGEKKAAVKRQFQRRSLTEEEYLARLKKIQEKREEVLRRYRERAGLEAVQ
ncbi:MAG: hypothetical protein KatS3mg082_1753 [Nitrospiraceae bacterium]|nr:MAG: hypothetical protein KatS3mg082_1753 [Nitrospiraceae bacterium]